MSKKKEKSLKKQWFKDYKILSALSLVLVIGVFIFTNYSSAQTKIVEYKIIDIGYVDCWTNSQGDWVHQTAWDGSRILTKPNTTVDYGFRVAIPQEYRGKVFKVDVEFLNGNITKYNNADRKPFTFEHYSANYDKHAVQNMTVTHSHNDDDYIYFNTKVTLSANLEPKDIREDWQAQLVQGWRYYTPTHITLTAEVEEDHSTNDKVIAKSMIVHPGGDEELVATFDLGELPIPYRHYRIYGHPTNPYISPQVVLMDKGNVNEEKVIHDFGAFSSSQ